MRGKMQTIVKLPDYEPSERQQLLHDTDAFEIFFGGAAGGGKTLALCAEAIRSCVMFPGQRVYYFRKTLKNLAQGTYPVIMQQIAEYNVLPDTDKITYNKQPLKITYNGTDKIFRFSNGSFIQFAYLNHPGDIYNYSSIEMHYLIIDECTQFTGDEYEFLKTRVRSGTQRPLRVIGASNPGDIGHNYFKDRFIVSPDPEAFYVPGEIIYETIRDELTDQKFETTRIFVPSKVEDNPNEHIQKEYLKTLAAIADPQLRKALREGDWDTFKGRIFTEWDKGIHVIRGKLPFDFDNSERYIGFDWGYNDAGVAMWVALAPPNDEGIRHFYAYREIHETGKHPRWWGKMVNKITENEPCEYMVLPHDCFSHLGGQRTIASFFEDYNLNYVRADSQNHAAKMHRIALMHELLSLAPDGLPWLMFHENCRNAIRTIPTLFYDDNKTEEVNRNADDHDFDSITYALMVIDNPDMYIYKEDEGKSQYNEFNMNNMGKAVRDSETRWLR
jgi:hypothetical protein